MATLVVATAAILRANLAEWCLLTLSITMVLALEMVNSALERIARTISLDQNQHLADALDIASAAVLIAAVGAAAVGTIVFVHRLVVFSQW